eukprot:7383413-Prymnesium_polylepis.2
MWILYCENCREREGRGARAVRHAPASLCWCAEPSRLVLTCVRARPWARAGAGDSIALSDALREAIIAACAHVVWALWLPRLVELAPVGEVHLAAAAEALEVHGEVVVDLRDHLLERRLPLGLQAHHHVLPLLEVVARLAEPAAHLLDRARPPLEVAHRRGVGVGAVRLLLQR